MSPPRYDKYSGKTGIADRAGATVALFQAAVPRMKEPRMSDRLSGLSRRRLLQSVPGAALGFGVLTAAPQARANEQITYLFPAPPILPAFGPIRLAQGKGYFSQADLDVSFAVGRGGVDVAKQVGAGNVPLGGIVADAPIIVRQNGVPVKMVAVFGGKGFMQLVVRTDSGINKPADLKGKTITVMSYQDTTFYALLGLLGSAGLTKDDVDIQAAGPVGVWQLVASGKSVGMAGVPDWIPPLEAAGVTVKVLPTDEFFPHMAQAIAASDQIIKDKPDMVRGFVKAALHGMKDIMADSAAAAADFVKFVPEWTGKEGQVKEAFDYYDKLVYPGQKVLGAIDPQRLSNLQDFYLAKGIIQTKSPVADLYTNQFVS
jgi:NitT/TauT family transport system substrate-binding protein